MIENNKLYRGIVLKNLDQEIQFGDTDIVMYYNPIINSDGQKTVRDGNEYGIYMTDNKTLVDDVYGKPNNEGNVISNIVIGNQFSGLKRITLPSIGIAYEIDSTQVDGLRRPWIRKELEGHYNNGFVGDEWICDKIQAGSYKIYRIMVGSDILHESQIIDINNKSKHEIEFELKSIFNSREQRLKELISFLEKIPEQKKRSFDLELYKDMFLDIKSDDNRRSLMLLDCEINGFGTDVQKYLFSIKNKIDDKNGKDVNYYLIQRIQEIDKRIEDLKLSNSNLSIVKNFEEIRKKYLRNLKIFQEMSSGKTTETQPGDE